MIQRNSPEHVAIWILAGLVIDTIGDTDFDASRQLKDAGNVLMSALSEELRGLGPPTIEAKKRYGGRYVAPRFWRDHETV